MPLIAKNSIRLNGPVIVRRATGNRGFTLIELVIASTILLIIVAATALMLNGSRRSYMSTDTSLTVQNQASLAFDIMRKELASAHNITPNAICSNCAIDFQLPLGTIQAGVPDWGAVDGNQKYPSPWRVEYRLETLPDNTRQLIRILQDVPGHDATGTVKRVIANNVDSSATSIFEVAADLVKIKLQITAPVTSSVAGDTRTTNLLRTQIQVHN